MKSIANTRESLTQSALNALRWVANDSDHLYVMTISLKQTND